MRIPPPPQERFILRTQSTTAPNGYDYNLYYVWDTETETISYTDHDRNIAAGWMASMNRMDKSLITTRGVFGK